MKLLTTVRSLSVDISHFEMNFSFYETTKLAFGASIIKAK